MAGEGDWACDFGAGPWGEEWMCHDVKGEETTEAGTSMSNGLELRDNGTSSENSRDTQQSVRGTRGKDGDLREMWKGPEEARQDDSSQRCCVKCGGS